MAGLTVRLHLVSTSLAWSLPRIPGMFGDEFTVQLPLKDRSGAFRSMIDKTNMLLNESITTVSWAGLSRSYLFLMIPFLRVLSQMGQQDGTWSPASISERSWLILFALLNRSKMELKSLSCLHHDATLLSFTIIHFASWNTLKFPRKHHLATGEGGHCTFLTACVSNARSSFWQKHRMCARLPKRSAKSKSFSIKYYIYIHINYINTNKANVSQCWFLKVVPFVSLAGDTAKTSAKHEFILFEERPSRTARWGNFGVAIRFAWQNWVGNRNRWFKLEKEQQAKWYRPQTAKVCNLCHSAIGNPCFLN